MRTPYQILLFPYIKKGDRFYYALFKREDMDVWQGIAGGGEKKEKPIDAVKREAFEEGGIPLNSKYVRLASMATIPVANICGFKWGGNIAIIPEFSFSVEMHNKNLKISREHKCYKWFLFDEAIKKLKWDSNKTALWELNYRLLKKERQCNITENIRIVEKYI